MTDPIDLLTVEQALAIAAQVPDLIQQDGDASVSRRAEACEITRGPNGWHISFPRTERVTLASGRTVPGQPLAPLQFDLGDIATETVTIGGYRIPIVLAQAIIGQFYTQKEHS